MKASADAYNKSLSFDQRRREIRRELFIQQTDRDNTESRLFSYAKKIDSQLLAEGYKLPYPTEWARGRLEKYSIKHSATLLQVDVADLFIIGDK